MPGRTAEEALAAQERVVSAAEALCDAYKAAGRGSSPAASRAHALLLAEKAYTRTLQLRADRERGFRRAGLSSPSATVQRGDDEGMKPQ